MNSMKKINLSAIIMLSIVLFAAGCTGTGERTVGTVGTTGLDAVSTDALTPDRPKVAVLLTEGFQDAEAYMPIWYLENKDVDITVIGPKTERRDRKSV